MLMVYEVDWLLDKADNDEIALASFIVKNNNDKIFVTELETEFDWSGYKVRRTVELLAQHLLKLYGVDSEGEHAIQLADHNRVVVVSKYRHINLDDLKQELLSQSLKWQMLVDMFNERMINYERYAAEKSVSVGTVGNHKKELEQLLLKYGVHITPQNTLEGDTELSVRLIFIQIYARFYGGRKMRFDQALSITVQDCHALLNKLIFEDNGKLSSSEWHFLKVYLLVSLTRERHGHRGGETLTSYILRPWQELAQRTQLILTQLVQKFKAINLLDEEADVWAQVQGFYLALYVVGLGGRLPWQTDLAEPIVQNVADLWQVMMRVFDSHTQAPMPEGTKEALSRDVLAPLILVEVYRAHNELLLGKPVRIDNAILMAPTTAQITDEIISEWQPSMAIDLEMMKNLFYAPIFMMLFSNVSLTLLWSPVNVLIDIRTRPNLELMLKRLVSGFLKINVQFVDDLKIADIVISDVIGPTANMNNRFNWQDFPNTKQISQLQRSLIELQRSKMTDKTEKTDLF